MKNIDDLVKDWYNMLAFVQNICKCKWSVSDIPIHGVQQQNLKIKYSPTDCRRSAPTSGQTDGQTPP